MAIPESAPSSSDLRNGHEFIDSQPSGSAIRPSFGQSRYGRRESVLGFGEFGQHVRVFAPATFSLVRKNIRVTERSIEFLSELEWYLNKGFEVEADFSRLQAVTTDAILALWSLPVKCRATERIGIRLGSNAEAYAKMIALDLFEQDDQLFRPKLLNEGMMFMHSVTSTGEEVPGVSYGDNYHYKVIRKVLEFSSDRLLGITEHLPGLKMLFDELKENVFQHASESDVGENWFLSVYYEPSDDGGGVVRYNLLDYGVGIVARIKEMWDRKNPGREFGWKSDREVLRAVLAGKFHDLRFESSGKGLPSISKMLNDGKIDDVVILANRALGRLKHNGFRSISYEFSGSLVHWEVSCENAELLRSEANRVH